jgi:pyridinium-3,5-bisthiocarboxylic acid mononucleotide nickel chelatase
MARILYFDCFSGCSGDMIIGALLDAGLEFGTLQKGLSGLSFGGYSLSMEKVTRSSISAIKFNVNIDEHSHDEHHHRGLSEILGIIDSSNLSTSVKLKSSAIFRKLGEIEAGVHGIPVEEVHFHELGAIDTIIDIVGTVFAIETLNIEQCYSSALPAGSGNINTSHGILPVPVPATLKILADAGAPLVSAPGTSPGELVTPTGAVLVTSLARFSRPDMKLEKVGHGAGSKDFPGWPNIMRIWIGEEVTAKDNNELVLLETNIDDMNPQVYGYLMDKLFAEKAADVWLTPIQMKKNRPATLLSVLAPLDAETRITDIIMRETSTLGIRSRKVSRHVAHREIIQIDSSLGRAGVKVKKLGPDVVQVSAEYEDCRRVASELNMPLREVIRIVEEEARHQIASQPR